MKALLSGLMALFTLIMMSCGGAGGVGSGGTGGFTGTQIGAVTGFGSVIVEGNTYIETGATYLRTREAGSALGSSSDALRLGMQVELVYATTAAGEQAQTITIKPTLIGTIQSVAADSIVVAGQRVRLMTAPAQVTVFENFASFSSLLAGMAVEVHGTLNSAGEILATRIELLSASASTEARLTGLISALQVQPTGTLRLTVGAQLVDVDSKTVLSQSSGSGSSVTLNASALAIGQRVSVYGSIAAGAPAMVASSLQLESTLSTGNVPLRVGGIISALGSNGSFSIGAVSVDASQAQFSSGSAADLAVGKQVRVDGSTGSTGVLRATKVQFVSTASDIKSEVSGTISDYVSSASFRIRNTVIDASAASVQYVGGSAAMLGNDVLVKVEGSLAGNLLKASKLTFFDNTDTRFRAYVGVVSGYVASAGTLTVQGINAHVSAGTTYSLSSGGAASATDLANGANVTVRGSLLNGVFEVSAVEISKPAQVTIVKTKGGAYEVNLTAQSFKVNGILVQWNAATQIDGVPGNLSLGYIAEAEGALSNGVLIAQRLKITKP